MTKLSTFAAFTTPAQISSEPAMTKLLSFAAAVALFAPIAAVTLYQAAMILA